jgi:hypothetical protein
MKQEKRNIEMNKAVEAAMVKAFQAVHPKVQTKEDVLKIIRGK